MTQHSDSHSRIYLFQLERSSNVFVGMHIDLFSASTQFLVTHAKVKEIEDMPTIAVMNEQLGNTPHDA